MTKSVTQTLAEWVVAARYEDLPEAGIQRVRDLYLDTMGVMLAGMSVSTGKLMAQWVEAQGARGECTVVGTDFKTTAPFAALANGTSGHALEFDDIATFGGHYANPLTASTLALAERLGLSGRDVILAFMVGWEVIAQTSKVTLSAAGNDLLNRGWFNQGFLPAIGVAALAAKMMGFDVDQTRMAMGHAASTMAGMLKNRGSDAKSFVAGNAAMHGIMAAELVGMGFTANLDIIDGEVGVARLLGLENGDPQKVLDGLGDWNLATRGASIRIFACCAASNWAQHALLNVLDKRPATADEIETIEVEIPDFLSPMMPYTSPQTGLDAKYSLEYDLVAIALDKKAGIREYTDTMVQRPEAQALIKRVVRTPTTGGMANLKSRVILTLKNGETHEDTVNRAKGTPADPLSPAEIITKFNECADEARVPQAQRQRIIELCAGLDKIENMAEFAEAIRVKSE